MQTLYSWNVNGLRATYRKGFLDWLHQTQPDVLALQETKCHPEQLTDELRHPAGYHTYWASAVKKGYSGVAIYSREEPLNVHVGIGNPKFDDEGRTLTAEYESFYFISTYVPSGSRDYSRVHYKLEYLDYFLYTYCAHLQATGKPLIICGDINIAHQEIDLARPKQNKKTSGFLPEERIWVDKFIEQGLIDIYRARYPERTDIYSWWSAIGNVRQRNVGWRLDYFLISEHLVPQVADAHIHPEVMGSDHCPVSITIS
ncbi:MAG: exodeoxyribonuclease III [Anaerolineales bacterium]|nr:exodeoxyribonuclease III [Anaerolineales bacterium]